MRILAIDPGNTLTAWLAYDTNKGRPTAFCKESNEAVLSGILVDRKLQTCGMMAIETMKPRGMPTSFEEMQTQLWAGRFIQAWLTHNCDEPVQMFRHDIKMHVCGNARAKDSNIRTALIDRYGGESAAIGGKKCRKCKGKMTYKREICDQCSDGWLHKPGPLNGITADCWSALAIAITFCETKLDTVIKKG